MTKKTSLYKRGYPIDANPFEAFNDGSWWIVKRLGIMNGSLTMHFDPPEFDTKGKLPITNLRLKSRKASMSDCICYLRPGVDICILQTSSSQAGSSKARFDAKINSIARKPHESGCTCRFYVNVYINHHPLLMERSKLDKSVKEVTIDEIAILQELDRKPCGDGYYRWESSIDCPSRIEAKLYRGQFSHDVSWLFVASSLKGLRFDIISLQNKIVYQIFDGKQEMCSSSSDKTIKAINFQIENGVMRPITQTFEFFVQVPVSAPELTIKEDTIEDQYEDKPVNFPLHGVVELRRSKRRAVQPDRFVGSNGWHLKRPKKESEMPCQTVDCDERPHQGEKTNSVSRRDLGRKFLGAETKIESSREHSGVTLTNGINRNIVRTRAKPEKELPSIHMSNKNKNGAKSSASRCAPLASNSFISPSTSKDHVLTKQLHPSDQLISKQLSKMGKTSSKGGVGNDQAIQSEIKNGRKESNLDSVNQLNLGERTRSASVTSSAVKAKLEKEETHNKLTGKSTSVCSKKRKARGYRIHYKTRFDRSTEYNDAIKRCMKNINFEIANHQSGSVPLSNSIRALMPSQRWRDVCSKFTVNDQVNEEDEELDCLWKEMEVSTNALHCFEENHTSDVDYNNEIVEVSNECHLDESSCQHEYKLDEEIGIICRICKSVATEIKYLSAPFLQSTGWIRDTDKWNTTNDLGSTGSGSMEFDVIGDPASSKSGTLQEEDENVWALIPEIKARLHIHQKKAFEFLWRNIAGSLVPANMEAKIKKTGGCVVSHSPGAGKTLLVISFIVSYLRLFPTKRPMILAPHTTLYAWEKEIKKWEVSIPIYQIHSRMNYRKELQSQTEGKFTGDQKLNRDVMHGIDCLEKLRKWHEHPSVLLMSYPSFFSMMREKSQLQHWRYMAKVLRTSPGILILDEGHHARSTSSMLRKYLMEVKTNLRILLSGTLFQNSFEEYFNTLSLARPRFISEVLWELDDLRGYRNGRKCRGNFKEKLARRLFVEKIAKMINSKAAPESKRGLYRLKKITNGFIDVYEGGDSDRLPGLQAYALSIKPTETQEIILSKLKTFDTGARYSLELELLMSLVSIHPWLVTTSKCAATYFDPDEIEELEKHKFDVKKGSKARFVVNLVHRCLIEKEKVLIFCRNIAPMKLFVEIFSRVFGWNEGKEVLILHGEQVLFERSKVIDKFEEVGGLSQVLLASIGACGEGISLTAASRVIVLDSEWNPSKIKQAVGRAFRPGQERMVYVYQLLSWGTVEETKHGKTEWKDWVSRMLFVGARQEVAGNEDTSRMNLDNIDDNILKDLVKEDEGKSFHMIMKDERLSNGSARGVEAQVNSSSCSTALLMNLSGS